MKTFTLASIVALAAVGSAQLDNIPSCALTCFIGPLTADGCSALTDFACHCKKGTELLSKVQPCVQGACSAADQATTIEAVEKTCKDAGVPIQIPGGASSAAPAPAPSSAAPAPAPSSAAPAPASSKAMTTVVAPSSAMGYPTASAVSSLKSALSSAAAVISSSAAANGTAPKPTPTISTFTGGAPLATQAAGLLGAAALAIFAL